MKEHFFIFNNDFFKEDHPIIGAGNRALRYGDGLFETIRMKEGRIINETYHFERFWSGMKTLKFDLPVYFSPAFFHSKTEELLSRNLQDGNARIRIMAFRSTGTIFSSGNHPADYIIETWPLPAYIPLNESGLTVGIFPDLRKSCDLFSNLKSNNYLGSVMAGLFAREHHLDDAVLLNVFGRVCESAIANLFIVKEGRIYTPPLSEGCVAGVMRRWMLERFSHKSYPVLEKPVTLEALAEADEVFLTNSIYLLRWIKSYNGKEYGNEKVREIFDWIQNRV